MSTRLTMSMLLVVFAIGLVWAYRPDQSRYDRLHPVEMRQPTAIQ